MHARMLFAWPEEPTFQALTDNVTEIEPEILNAMAAKHVIVVADSCYSGALTRSSIGQLETGLTDEHLTVAERVLASAPPPRR